MTPHEAFTLTYKTTPGLIGLNNNEIADIIREKDLENNVKLSYKSVKIGCIAEIDPKFINRVKFKD